MDQREKAALDRWITREPPEPPPCRCSHADEDHDDVDRCAVAGCDCQHYEEASPEEPDWMTDPERGEMT